MRRHGLPAGGRRIKRTRLRRLGNERVGVDGNLRVNGDVFDILAADQVEYHHHDLGGKRWTRGMSSAANSTTPAPRTHRNEHTHAGLLNIHLGVKQYRLIDLDIFNLPHLEN